jgi:hypothetical protein
MDHGVLLHVEVRPVDLFLLLRFYLRIQRYVFVSSRVWDSKLLGCLLALLPSTELGNLHERLGR